MPFIDEALCRNCGQCKTVCPLQHQAGNTMNTTNPRAYACWLKDDQKRAVSTSGGAFSALAEYVLQQNGVVAGCVMGPRLSAHHVLALDRGGIYAMHGSKYIQSEIRDTYQLVKKYLYEDRTVLFTGCPCQVAGLYQYLKPQKFSNLLTADLVCHGVASKKFFDKYLAEKEAAYGSPVLSIQFRSKKHGWDHFTVQLKLADGREIVIPSIKDAFMRCYYQKGIYRESCYQCHFARMPRTGDFTLGDYSGVPRNVVKRKAFKQGISLITLNNEKAEKIFKNIKDSLVHFERPIEEAIRTNRNLAQPSMPHPQYNKILVSDASVAEIADNYCRSSWKKQLASLIGQDRVAIAKKLLKRS